MIPTRFDLEEALRESGRLVQELRAACEQKQEIIDSQPVLVADLVTAKNQAQSLLAKLEATRERAAEDCSKLEERITLLEAVAEASVAEWNRSGRYGTRGEAVLETALREAGYLKEE